MVCRLVFEGSCFCLFWGLGVFYFKVDLCFILFILEILKDDISEIVCWSVVNYFNDIVKDYLELVFDLVEDWSGCFRNIDCFICYVCCGLFK